MAFFENGKSWRTSFCGVAKLLLFLGAVGSEFAVGGTAGHILALSSLLGREIVSTVGDFNTKDVQVTGAPNAIGVNDVARTPLTADVVAKP